MLIFRSCVCKVRWEIILSLLLVVSAVPRAIGQDSLVPGLKQKYRLTQINTQGVVANPGTVLTIEADGINAEPYPTMMTFENPVVDGQVKQRSKGLSFLKSTNLQILQPGQKVYITKINSSDDSLKVTILTADAIVATYTGSYGGSYRTPKRYSTTLSFKLTKEAISKLSVDDASKMIESVLSFNQADQVRVRDTGVVTRACEPHCAVSATTGMPSGTALVTPASMPNGVQEASDPSASAPTIALGQTPEQVTAVLGPPAQIVDLGSKKIYKYPDMKIVFIGGKVSDVQ